MTTERACAICGSLDDLTVEHIIPQTLLKTWGRDPNDDETKSYRTWLCATHQSRMAKIHDRPAMRTLIVDGEPASEKALSHLAEWSVWVTMLLGIANGQGVWPTGPARYHLVNQFSNTTSGGGAPKGTRVYAARFDEQLPEQGQPAFQPSYAVALRDDDRIMLSAHGTPLGIRSKAGVVSAAKCLGIGQLVVLVLGPTWASGSAHRERLDAVPESFGFVRIHPLPSPIPSLQQLTVDIRFAEKLFTVEPLLATDLTLLPGAVGRFIATFHDGGSAHV